MEKFYIFRWADRHSSGLATPILLDDGMGPWLINFRWSYVRNKKSNFLTDLSAKNRFSSGMETILTKKNRKKKNRKNRRFFTEKSDIFPKKSDFSRNFE